MLFTRTIRRKLLLGAGLVLGMLLILSASGISGLNSYRRVIRDLDDNITKEPQPAELIAAAGALMKPIHSWPVKNDAGSAFQQKQFAELLENAKDRFDKFRRRSDNLPPSSVWQGQKYHLPVQAKSVTDTKVTVPVFHGESTRKLQSVQAQKG